MKKWATLLTDGEYKMINIWDVLHWKKNMPEFWELSKDSIYSIHKNIEDKVPMVFQTGRNNIYGKSYFRYKDANSINVGEGYEESYQHEFFKECFSRIKILNLVSGKENIKIYIDGATQEEEVYTKDGKKRIVDVMIQFSKAEPMIYVEKWNGKLAIEVYQTHKVDNVKIKEFKNIEIAMVEFNATKWYVTDDFQTKEDEEKQFNNVISKLNNFVYVNILSDPISKKYFSSTRLEEEIRKNELYLKRINYLNSEIDNLKKENQNLLSEIKMYGDNETKLKKKLEDITNEYSFLKEEIESIKCKTLYKLFYKKN